MLSIIVAFGENYEIGRQGTMPWHLPEDLKHFKQITLGKTMLMGRRTFESLPGVLPKRTHVIITANPEFTKEHSRVRISHSLEEELRQAQKSSDEIFVIGGGQIYQQALPFVSKLYLTRIHKSFADADAFFPALDWNEWQITEQSGQLQDEASGLTYEFITCERIVNTARTAEE